MRKKDATLYDQTMQKMSGQSILSVAGSLENHPAAEDYARIMQELREQRKKEAELLYPDEADTESGL